MNLASCGAISKLSRCDPSRSKAERIIFRFGVSPDEIREEFLSGRFSLASDLFPADVEALRQQPQFAAGYRDLPRLSIYFAAFNIHRPPFDDVAVRRRVASAVDVPGIVRRVLGRLAIPAHGVIPPGLPGYVAGATTARTASSESRSTRETPLELTAAVHATFFGQYSAAAKELASALSERGVKLKIVNKTLAEYLQHEKDADVDVGIGRWIADYPDADTFAYGVMHTKGGTAGALCGTPELDRLIERGRVEIDPGARHEIYREVDEMIIREALLMPLFHEQVYRFVRPEVGGLTLSFAAPEVSYEALGIR